MLVRLRRHRIRAALLRAPYRLRGRGSRGVPTETKTEQVLHAARAALHTASDWYERVDLYEHDAGELAAVLAAPECPIAYGVALDHALVRYDHSGALQCGTCERLHIQLTPNANDPCTCAPETFADDRDANEVAELRAALERLRT